MSDNATPPVIALTHKSTELEQFAPLVSAFKKFYNATPDGFILAPGRVNIIGEHIDYCGYAVLPMAIEKYITVLVKVNPNRTINLVNADSNYPSYNLALEDLGQDCPSIPRWFHYFLSGVRGVFEAYPEARSSFVGMDLLVHGTVPPSAGLSSSSALVCSAALATCFANKIQMSKVSIADLCAKAERYVGTQGGGMDQAISFLAEAGTAKLIDFNPLRTSPVTLPPDATFVVAHSAMELNKSSTAHYNTRVVECKLAAKLLAKHYGLPPGSKAWPLSAVAAEIKIPLSNYQFLVESALHPLPYTREELCKILGDLSDQEFQDRYLTPNTSHLTEFKLYDRALHVFGEANRVQEFAALCAAPYEGVTHQLGALMNESHESCSKLYECSHEDLDELTAAARKSGALGSRLTGAGWGGCTISLVPKEKVDSFLDSLKREFYDKKEHRKLYYDKFVFPTSPGGGALIYTTQL